MASVVELPAVSISLPADWKPRETSPSSLSGWYPELWCLSVLNRTIHLQLVQPQSSADSYLQGLHTKRTYGA